LLAKAPKNAALLNNYAVTLYKQGNREEAVRHFRAALEIDPSMKDARDGLSVALGAPPAEAAPPTRPQQDPALPPQSTLGPSPLSAPAGPAFDPLGIQGK
jgi:tetratricopeptide (TPR) repeat protein